MFAQAHKYGKKELFLFVVETATSKIKQLESLISRLYFRNDLLSTSAGIDSMGSILKDNLLYLVIVWVLVYFAIFKGVNWAAKVKLSD